MVREPDPGWPLPDETREEFYERCLAHFVPDMGKDKAARLCRGKWDHFQSIKGGLPPDELERVRAWLRAQGLTPP